MGLIKQFTNKHSCVILVPNKPFYYNKGCYNNKNIQGEGSLPSYNYPVSVFWKS